MNKSITSLVFGSIIFLLLLILVLSSYWYHRSLDDPIRISEKEVLESLAFLPEILEEGSGLERMDGDVFFAHNDGKGQPEIYAFDQNGNLQGTTRIAGVSNRDWEEVAIDEVGNFYIGDFGNNDNDRRDLVIHRTEPLPVTDAELPPESIRFDFEDQDAFPPPATDRHFDVEAFFVLDDWIYLFTKDRSKPLVGKTRLYRLPNQPGTHTARYLDEFYTSSNSRKKGAITSADLSPDGKRMALLSRKMIWIFDNFQPPHFFKGTVRHIELPVDRQMEGIVFKDNQTLYLINERSKKEAAILHKLTID